MFGAFIVGYCAGALISPPDAAVARPGPPRGGRFGGGGGITLPIFLGIVGAVIAALVHVDLRDLSLTGRAQRNAAKTYIGWDARVIKRIPAHGFGEIALRDGMGNVTSVAATSDVDVAEGATVVVTGTRDLNVTVAPADLKRTS